MSQEMKTRWAMASVIMVSFAALCLAGCDSSEKLNSLRLENLILTRRVAELEDQLKQAEADLSAATADAQAPVDESVYIVVEDDSLWSIAENKLGSGTRYKEILALNPHVTKDQPLAIGTELKLPSR